MLLSFHFFFISCNLLGHLDLNLNSIRLANCHLNVSVILEFYFYFFGPRANPSNPQPILSWVGDFLVRQKGGPVRPFSLNIGFIIGWPVPPWISSFDNSSCRCYLRIVTNSKNKINTSYTTPHPPPRHLFLYLHLFFHLIKISCYYTQLYYTTPHCTYRKQLPSMKKGHTYFDCIRVAWKSYTYHNLFLQHV